jgi:nitrogen regulatory protein P-II 1
MKKIEAIIDPEMLSRVLTAMHALDHFPGITVSDCQGQGRGEGPGGKYVPRGPSWAFARKTQIEVFCNDSEVDRLVTLISNAARMGDATRGIIAVIPLERVVRTRSGQEQEEAL